MAKTNKPKVKTDQLYMTIHRGLVKCGKTGNVRSRFSASSYNAGGFKDEVFVHFWALPGQEEHINTLEKFYKRKFYDFLKKSEKNPNLALEYVDEKFKNITIEYIRPILEDYIKRNNLSIMRLNPTYLPSLMGDDSFAEKVRTNPGKYLEDI